MSNSILLKKRAKKYSNKYYRNPLPKRPGARCPWAFFFFDYNLRFSPGS